MADFKQIVVGAGTSAHTFLYYADIGRWSPSGKRFDPRQGKVLIVGESDLWQDIHAGNDSHKVGQPPHMLALPHVDKAPPLSKAFMSTKDLVKTQDRLANAAKAGLDVTTLRGRVLKIAKQGQEYVVTTSKDIHGKNSFTAEQVIIATPGPQQRPSSQVLPEAPNDAGQPYQRVIDAVTYMNNLQPPVNTVCVHGSAATSAWAVSRAMASGVQSILWVARTGFIETNPAGRNNDVMNTAFDKGWLTIGDISKIQTAAPFPSGDPKEHLPTIKLSFGAYDESRKQKAQQDAVNRTKEGAKIYELYRALEVAALEESTVLKVKTRDGYKEVPVKSGGDILVNQYVYAIGATTLAQATGAGGILASDIALTPVYDEEKRFGDVSDETVIAFTDGGGLWVVGAAVFRIGTEGKKYTNVTQMMAKSGHPPEGIAGIVASLRALTGSFDGGAVNFATADFAMLERWAANVYREMKRLSETTLTYGSLPAELQRFVADQIVALRKHTTFSVEHLKGEQDDAIVDTVKAILSSPQALAAWLPPNLQKTWAKR